MCRGCWEDYGSPRIDNERVRAAAKLIEEVYEYSCVGGGMHIQVDDWNLDDEHFGQGTEAYLENDAERRCFVFMKEMSVEERASALAIHDGYVLTGDR